MFPSWNGSFITVGFSFDGYHRFLERQWANLQHRVQNWTWLDLFFLLTYFLAVHAFARSFKRLYRQGMAYLRRRRNSLIVRRPKRVVRRNKMKRSAKEESTDNGSNKPIWRPKLKKKHRRRTRQGW